MKKSSRPSVKRRARPLVPKQSGVWSGSERLLASLLKMKPGPVLAEEPASVYGFRLRFVEEKERSCNCCEGSPFVGVLELGGVGAGCSARLSPNTWRARSVDNAKKVIRAIASTCEFGDGSLMEDDDLDTCFGDTGGAFEDRILRLRARRAVRTARALFKKGGAWYGRKD